MFDASVINHASFEHFKHHLIWIDLIVEFESNQFNIFNTKSIDVYYKSYNFGYIQSKLLEILDRHVHIYQVGGAQSGVQSGAQSNAQSGAQSGAQTGAQTGAQMVQMPVSSKSSGFIFTRR